MSEVEIKPMPVWSIVYALTLSPKGPYHICYTLLISKVLLIQEHGPPAPDHWCKVSIHFPGNKAKLLQLSSFQRLLEFPNVEVCIGHKDTLCKCYLTITHSWESWEKKKKKQCFPPCKLPLSCRLKGIISFSHCFEDLFQNSVQTTNIRKCYHDLRIRK